MITTRRRHPWVARLLGRRDERGATAAEFIVVVPVMMLIFLLLVQWSVQLYNDRLVRAAAREAAVAAAAWDGSTAAGRETARAYLASNGSDLSGTKVSVSLQGEEATATVSGRCQALIPGFDTKVSATTTVPRERFAQ